jgi:predicted RNA-binding protein YlqC (UPF0109 family)
MAETQADDGVQADAEVAPADVDIVGATLAYLARSLVEHVDDVRVEQLAGDRGAIYRLHVNPEDMGRVIGRSGRIARALRQVTRAAASRADVHAIVEIAD